MFNPFVDYIVISNFSYSKRCNLLSRTLLKISIVTISVVSLHTQELELQRSIWSLLIRRFNVLTVFHHVPWYWQIHYLHPRFVEVT